MVCETLTGLDVLTELMDGRVIEYGDRYYRYNEYSNKVEYSDTKIFWKNSTIQLNQIINGKWNVVE